LLDSFTQVLIEEASNPIDKHTKKNIKQNR